MTTIIDFKQFLSFYRNILCKNIECDVALRVSLLYIYKYTAQVSFSGPKIYLTKFW